jgi:tetrahydromethanopterin S-methyltransferase subunit F
VIIEFENIRCNKFSFEYHSQKYRTRLHFMRINYERSKRLEFGVNRVYGEGLRDSVQLVARRKRLRGSKEGEEQ